MKKTYDTLRQFGDLKLLDEKEIEAIAKLWDIDDPQKIKDALGAYACLTICNNVPSLIGSKAVAFGSLDFNIPISPIK